MSKMLDKLDQIEKQLNDKLLLHDLKIMAKWILENPSMPTSNVVAQLKNYENKYGEDIFILEYNS